MYWMEQIKATLRWLKDNPSVTWSGIGTTLLVAAFSWFLTSSGPPDVSVSPPVSVLTIEQYKKDLLELHEKYLLEKHKREEIERKLANPDESYQEKLRLLEESKEKLQQMAGSLHKQQPAQAAAGRG